MTGGSRMYVVLPAVLLIAAPAVTEVDLQPKTVAAFNRYVAVTEARISTELADPARFLALEAGTDRSKLDAVRRGELLVERLQAQDRGRSIDVPDGLVHHWRGTMFVPGVSLDQTLRFLQDYDRYADVYKPAVARSKSLGHEGDTYRMSLRYFMKKGLTVVLNTEHEARFTRHEAGRVSSRIVSTRIAEVENPGTPQEREKPIGEGGGYLWRLNTYWRVLERDGGTYILCESISLTRGIPFGLGWLIGPFVKSIPRESLDFTLDTTRKALVSRPNAGR